jgi:Flp pilus assembly protein protease CpaA
MALRDFDSFMTKRGSCRAWSHFIGMKMASFFPSPIFGWAFCVFLVGLLAVSTYTDLRWIIISNKLVVLIAIAGLLANLLRGTWLGIKGTDVWILPASQALGWMDGIAFSLAGFIVGLMLGIPLYAVGAAGGGDGKLMAAVGAWVGPTLLLIILFVASFIMLIFMIVRAITILIISGSPGLKTFYRRPDDPRGAGRLYRLMAFSPALLLAALIVLPLKYRQEFERPSTSVAHQKRGDRN